MARSPRLGRGRGRVLDLLPFGAGVGLLLFEPWHGPIILSLSATHGVDAGDLPAVLLMALTVTVVSTRAQHHIAKRPSGRRRPPPHWVGAAAVAVGALLLSVGAVGKDGGGPLVPSGGGTFDGVTRHISARRSDPVNAWSHIALTYDGKRLRLYVNGAQVSSRATTGALASSSDPLWIGGNRPFGEYFEGLIDEVRVYDRPLRPAEVRLAMTTPIARSVPGAATPLGTGLVGAYGFRADSDATAVDSSGAQTAGKVIGAKWTPHGRFGGALSFDGRNALVRVAASAALGFKAGMALAAWIRPTALQAGWRTVVHRQTNVYFLAAGSDEDKAVGPLDDLRAALLVGSGLGLCIVLAAYGEGWVGDSRRLLLPSVALFLAGSVVDAVRAPSTSLVGSILVALWFALVSASRREVIAMALMAAVFTAATMGFLPDLGGIHLSGDDGGVARSPALGLLLVGAGVLGLLRPSESRPARFP